MKRTTLLIIAILFTVFAKAQTKDSFCIVMNKILDLGNTNKIGELKGDSVDRMLFLDAHYYKSTLVFPGFTSPEVRQFYPTDKFWFSTHILYDNNTDMMNAYKATQKKIEDCLTADHQQLEPHDNDDHDEIWWKYKNVKITLHYYVSGIIYVVDLAFDPND